MKDIDFLEGSALRELIVKVDRERYYIPDPREMHYQAILAYLHARIVPDMPDAPEWTVRLVFDRWRAIYDLPTFEEANRLCYLVDHYQAAIYSDIATFLHLDLRELWSARRWQTLLHLIDRLPGHSYYAAQVAQDPEHARMLAERIAAQAEDDGAPTGPALTSWTPEVAMLTKVLDAVRRLEYTTIAAQHGSAVAGQPPKPEPRPNTPLEAAIRKAEHDRRMAKHKALVARVLPNRG